MNRRTFMHLGGLVGITGFLPAHMSRSFFQQLPDQPQKMPVLFVGHGNPMNAIEDNVFTRGWKALVQDIPRPTAILCISAHWETRGTQVLSARQPRMIYDMYGFPRELYEVRYPAPGAPEVAREIQEHVHFDTISLTDSWGFDHGTWSILSHMYPHADTPCFQLSLNKTRDLQWHYELAKELRFLRRKGVLIVGSGNIVHNLRYMRQMFQPSPDWALEFDAKSTELIQNGMHDQLIRYQQLGRSAEISVNSAEHYIPMLYAIAQQEPDDSLQFANAGLHDTLIGTGMRCIRIG